MASPTYPKSSTAIAQTAAVLKGATGASTVTSEPFNRGVSPIGGNRGAVWNADNPGVRFNIDNGKTYIAVTEPDKRGNQELFVQSGSSLAHFKLKDGSYSGTWHGQIGDTKLSNSFERDSGPEAAKYRTDINAALQAAANAGLVQEGLKVPSKVLDAPVAAPANPAGPSGSAPAASEDQTRANKFAMALTGAVDADNKELFKDNPTFTGRHDAIDQSDKRNGDFGWPTNKYSAKAMGADRKEVANVFIQIPKEAGGSRTIIRMGETVAGANPGDPAKSTSMVVTMKPDGTVSPGLFQLTVGDKKYNGMDRINAETDPAAKDAAKEALKRFTEISKQGVEAGILTKPVPDLSVRVAAAPGGPAPVPA